MKRLSPHNLVDGSHALPRSAYWLRFFRGSRRLALRACWARMKQRRRKQVSAAALVLASSMMAGGRVG